DGLETTGNLEAELATARRFGIPIHYRDYNDVPRPGELMVTAVKVPENLKANIPFVATASVRATARIEARCELFLDGVFAEGKDVTFHLGDATVTLEGKFKDGGDKTVAVDCTPTKNAAGVAASDRFESNNRYEIPVKVPRKPKVLYVEGDRRHSRNLSIALSRDFDLEVRGARGVPSSFSDANKYDLIFISDVPRIGDMNYQNMTTSQMQVLERYARSGGGLVFSGGENAYGPGGYTSTHLERRVLPVRLDVTKKQDIPGVALMLVIDRSGSMTGEKIELAKEAATATLGVLNPNDLLGIIAFDSRPSQIVKLQRASNHLRIKNAVSRLRPGGGTDIFQALDRAFAELRRTRAKVKHIILLTDGQSNRSGIVELGTQAGEHRITVSTVAVGLQTDHQLLGRLAEVAGGNSYRTTSAKNVPKLFVKEASQVTRKALVEEQFRPRVPGRFRHLQMFKGLNMGAAPALIGYVSTRAKSRAEVLMVSHTGEPVLARWRLGLGKVLAWTSDVKSRWSYYWLKWGGYAKFWHQVIRDTMRVEGDDPTYQMVTEVTDGVLTVGVDAVDAEDRFIDGVASDVTVTGPDGKDITLTLTQTAAGRYEGRVPLSTFGPYTIRGTHIRAETPDAEEEVHTSFAQVAWPFPQEHLVGMPDLTAVTRVATATGGVRDPANAVLFDVAGAETEKRTPMWPYPLYVAMALLLLDILLRRVRFYGKTKIRWSNVSG
ncbi:MAG: Ca-activated chloride channel family protein, partial [Myxococcota bacterium]